MKSTQNIKYIPLTCGLSRAAQFFYRHAGYSNFLRLIALIGASLISASSAMAGPPPPPEMRDWPYCEFLIHVPTAPPGKTLPVFNSLGYCASRDWQILNTNDIVLNYNAQYPLGNPTVLSTGANSLLVNWPRAFVFDHAVENTSGSDLILFSSGLAFGFAGFNTGAPGKAYAPSNVTRSTVFNYEASDLIYQLTSPIGEIYVMQSYAMFVDTSLTYEKLKNKHYMAKRIKLPAGWSYDVKVLTQGFDNSSGGNATVIQDGLGNTYMKVDPGVSRPPVGQPFISKSMNAEERSAN
jgi:hypothetical protein